MVMTADKYRLRNPVIVLTLLCRHLRWHHLTFPLEFPLAIVASRHPGDIFQNRNWVANRSAKGKQTNDTKQGGVSLGIRGKQELRWKLWFHFHFHTLFVLFFCGLFFLLLLGAVRTCPKCARSSPIGGWPADFQWTASPVGKCVPRWCWWWWHFPTGLAGWLANPRAFPCSLARRSKASGIPAVAAGVAWSRSGSNCSGMRFQPRRTAQATHSNGIRNQFMFERFKVHIWSVCVLASRSCRRCFRVSSSEFRVPYSLRCVSCVSTLPSRCASERKRNPLLSRLHSHSYARNPSDTA